MSFLHFYNFSRLSYLLVFILVLPLVACSGGDGGPDATSSNVANLSWVAPVEREDGAGLSPSEIAGFRVYYGTKPGVYSNTIDIKDHTTTQTTLADLPSGTYYIVVTAVDTDGRESSYSTEAFITL